MGLDPLRFATFLTQKRVDIGPPENYYLVDLERFFTDIGEAQPAQPTGSNRRKCFCFSDLRKCMIRPRAAAILLNLSESKNLSIFYRVNSDAPDSVI
jgi:hypothetical protein